MALHDKFSAHAQDYNLYRPHYPETLAQYLATLPPSCDCAVDVGCGSGQLSASLARYFHKVLGFDLSRRQVASAEAGDNITYAVSVAESLPLEKRAADLITVAQALHWFDIEAFWQEVKRIAKPGGIIAAICYGRCTISPEIDAVIDEFYDGLSPYWAPERKLVETAYRTVNFPFDEITPPQLVMTQNWNGGEFLAYLSTWSAVKACEADGKDPMKSLEKTIKPLYNYTTEKPVHFPLYMRIGRL